MKSAISPTDLPPSTPIRTAESKRSLKHRLQLFVVIPAMLTGLTERAQALLTNGNMDASSVSSQRGATPTGWIVDASKTASGTYNDGASSETWNNVAAPNGKGLFFKPFQGSPGDDPITVHVYQDNPATPGQRYVMTGYAGAEAKYSGLLEDTDTISEFALEFLDGASVVIGGYVLDLVADGLTAGPNFGYAQHSVTATAPAGTGSVRVRASMINAYNNGGAQAFVVDAFELTTVADQPPIISNIRPNGSTLFNPVAAGLTFIASSASANINASGIQVILNGLDVSSALVISGPTNNRSVAYTGLEPNQLYSAVINVVDDTGNPRSAAVSFETFASDNFSWEAEDYDFNGGSHFNNPSATSSLVDNSYFGRSGTPEIDYHESGGWGGNPLHAYREEASVGPGLEWAVDFIRQRHADAIALDPEVHDYDVGWINGLDGDWMNYTRTIAAGAYNLYGRLAGGGGVNKCQMAVVTAGVGTETQTTNVLGLMTMEGTGYQAWQWVPLNDGGGNLVNLTYANPTDVTFRVSGDGLNMNFFMLVPARTDLPRISSLYPTGLKPFEPGETLSFHVTSTSATLPPENIQVFLNGNDVTPLLTIGGTPTDRSVALAVLAANATYTAEIRVTDSAGTFIKRDLTFDTFSESNYSFEAEDYNFDSGRFISSPTLSTTAGENNYFQQSLPSVEAVDISGTPPISGYGVAYGRLDPIGTELTADYLRQAYVTAQGFDPLVDDYNVGWGNAGTWFNYTRTIPAGSYWVYARLAGPQAFSARMETVTGANSIDQTATPLGTLTATSGGYQTWVWVPLIGTDGNPAVFAPGGTATLRFTTEGNLNLNYFMLVPAKSIVPLNVTISAGNPVISIPTQTGASYTIQSSPSLASGTWTYLNMVVGDGTTKTVVDASVIATQRYYRAIIH